MPLPAGVRLGPYEVMNALGAGGMGEVYCARDTRLDRTVAIKILPAAVAGDPTFRERFDREARAVAALNHPHICALYDIGEEAGIAFLVMEYLEGETLADRLTKGALPIDQALKYAIQIAEALDKAHRAGIVHRDLKPGNIMLTKAGAKLLDFGLAKTSSAAGLSSMSILPTAHSLVTAQGTILGTLQYMAPEQVEGREADARSDIFAFGAIVYEMVTGKRAFEGKSQASVIAAILDREPPAMSALRPLTPSILEHIVQRCLAKDAAERWQSAGDVMRELAWVTSSASSQPAGTTYAIRKRSWATYVAWITASVVALATVALGMMYRSGAPIHTKPVRFVVAPPLNVVLFSGTRMASALVSPDGRYIVFGANRPAGATSLWLRSLDTVDARPLAGTENAAYPFWSPDSRMLGFFSGGKLKTVDVTSGQIVIVCDAPNGVGGAWNDKGLILFAQGNTSPLFKVPATGGTPLQVTKIDLSPRQISHRFPFFLPDGKRFLFLVYPSNTIWLGSLDTAEARPLLNAESQATYADPGYLLFSRQGTLLAQRFDVSTSALIGEAAPIAPQVARDGNFYAIFSASKDGVVAYRSGAVAAETQLTWFDRTGHSMGALGQPGFLRNPALSPDATRVAFEVVDLQGRNQDIWIEDVVRRVRSRFTFDSHNDVYPLWSPDGARVIFASDRDGGIFNVYEKAASGVGEDARTVKSTDDMTPYGMSPDGRFLLFRFNITNTGILPLKDDRKPRPFLQAEFTQTQAQVSFDGRWLAYASNESGDYEIYVRNFPDGTGKWQVSQGGAVNPRWDGSGNLYYYTADGRLMTVTIKGDKAAEVGTPVSLFEPHLLNGPSVSTGFRAQYEPTRDGRRFLMNVALEESMPTPITVVLNWPETLEK
jgi:Tol biopolymer transport system component/predicted Ser/Thr protein kinase